MRRRVVLVAAVALAAIAAAVVVVVSRPGRGPLVPAFDGQIGIGWILHLGDSGSMSGGLSVYNRSDRSLVLDRVEGVGLQNGGPGLLGAYVVPHHTGIGRVIGYHVPRDGRSLPGAIVRPHETLELVIGVKATRSGRHGFDGLRVLYRDGSTRYTTNLPFGVTICAPITAKKCPVRVGD